MDRDRTDLPPENVEPGRPRVGVDEWVAQVDQRRDRPTGIAGVARRIGEVVTPPIRLAIVVVLAALVPLWLGEGDLFNYGIFVLLYILLGLGLNVVVGFAGLLDLGYVAFFGFGAYFYALLSSEHYGIHWPAIVSIPLVVLATSLLGLVLGIPSRRLLGDYLAIVTLFFGQAFVVFVNASNPKVAGKGLTGGPNGVADIDPVSFFGYEFTTRTQQYALLLAAGVVVLVGLHFLSESRTGRALRALREDPLAAEAMSIPVNRLKLLAFGIGAGIAGFTGCMFATLLTAVTPGNFDVPILITVYAVVILGGFGSLSGVILGAVVITVSFQFLAPENPQNNARVLFYTIILLAIVLAVRSWWRLLLVLAGTVGLGIAVHAIVAAFAPTWTSGQAVEAGRFGDLISDWVIIPQGHPDFGNVAYVALVVALLVLTQMRPTYRLLAIPAVAYLAAVVWETSFVEQPAVARWILFGALLVVLMNVRPQGLLGTPRVEIA
ncbi:MAG: branched-chain amino acid ABC transporter permease [Actinobacteria bacterium]|nr:branched-chain amino acid ABC transporter permease [Actinomycetota bacterium]